MNTFVMRIKTITTALLDVLLPRAPNVRRLERMDAHALIARARKASRDPAHPGITAIFDYRDPLVKALIWEIKFRGNKKLTRLAAETMYENLLAELGELALFDNFSNPLVVPVPLSKERLRERGFNQAKNLTEELSHLDGGRNFEVSLAVIKLKDTPSQTRTKNKTEREQNLRGAFGVTTPREVVGRNIIVIDDVYTTGSTLSEISRMLNGAGALRVIGFTLAH